MKFTQELRAAHPELQSRFDELEEFLGQYDKRFKRRLIRGESRPARLLGYNAAQLLLTSLSRARFLAATIIHCANGGLALGMYLAARAHWEMTGLVAHLLASLKKLYAKQVSESDFETTMKRLALGRRWEIPTDLKEDVSAINAISLVESAAKYFGKEFDKTKVEQHITACYNFLSEFCHPNLMGRLTGVTLSDDKRIVNFTPEFSLDGRDLRICFSQSHASHALFLHAYDECFKLLQAHEELPTLET